MAKTLRALFLGIALISTLVACVSYVLLSEIRRTADTSDAAVPLVIEEGDSTSTIATKLSEAGLIRQPLLFAQLVRWQNLDGKLQAGRYTLQPNMTMSQIIASLQNSRTEELQVQIIEGLRLEEIAERIGNAGFEQITAEDFTQAVRNGASFQSKYFFLNSLPDGASLEGYLFPDTYRFTSTATVTEVVDIMLSNFDSKYKTIERSVQIPDVNVHQVVTMASIVQREAARVDEMTRISAVFWNRLKPENADETGGGKLQADPTVQYVLGLNTGPSTGTWWPVINLSNDEINGLESPYNTRVNPGLPPGPIASPGLDALSAAAQPDESANYLYFVASCTDPGAHNFAVTFEEFQQFEQEWLRCRR